jgi:hypothetical protein
VPAHRRAWSLRWPEFGEQRDVVERLEHGAGLTGPTVTESQPGQSDIAARLRQLKEALDAELIAQDDYDAAKAKALGLLL